MAGSLPGPSPRALFAERFALLYAAAGHPPLKKVENQARQAGRVDAEGRPIRVSNQRVSDWRAGRNVPSQFAALAVVLEVLIKLARDDQATPLSVDGLYDIGMWRTWWSEALASPADPSASGPEPAATPGICPYPGLAAFTRENSGWFFGRDRATRKVVDLLAATADTPGPIIVVGPSGAGKSSLISAGLLPELAKGALPLTGSSTWPVVTMTPGAQPLKELVAQIPELAEPLGRPDDHRSGTAIREAVAAHARRRAGESARLVLVVDQFEELFTLCRGEDERSDFVWALHAAATAEPNGTSPASVVLGLRADLYGRCLDYPDLAATLQHRQFVLGPMTTPELRTAISSPAKAVGLQLESGLVELILRDLGGGGHRGQSSGTRLEGGALPLLSHALLATWLKRQPGKLTISGYLSAGAIHGAISTTAERAWAELNEREQAAARQLLLRLVHIGNDTADTRRRSTRKELSTEVSDTAATDHVIEVLAAARLITLDTERVEITHEALLSAWPRLRDWIDQDRAGNLLRQNLERDAHSWQADDQDSSMLYRGTRLATAQQWLRTTRSAQLSAIARRFLAHSARYQRRIRWAGRAAICALLTFALVAAGAAVLAIRQRDNARFQQVVAEADQLAGTNPSLSAQLLLVAHRMRPADQNVGDKLLSTQSVALATPLIGHTGAVYLTSYSPDGHMLATASYDHTVRLWDIRDPARPRALGSPLRGHTSWVSSAVFSPDGHILVSAGDDGTLRFWNVTDPARPIPFGQPVTAHDGTIYLVAFSPDGRTLATANQDGTVRLWSIADAARPVPLPPLTGPGGAVRSVAFGPGGELLAAGGDEGTVRLWNVSVPRHPAVVGGPLAAHTSTVHSVAFSPDGRTLATASADKTIRLWNVTDPARPAPLGTPLAGHVGDVWSVAFSPDGHMLVSGSSDGTARLWNVTKLSDPTALGQPLAADNGGVNAVSFSPDGRTVATGGEDGVARLWALPPAVLVGPASSLLTTAFSPDGHILATAGEDDTARLWDVTDPAHPTPLGTPLSGHTSYINSIAFSQDGHTLATASGDRTFRLWNVSDPAHATLIGQPVAVRTRYGNALAFSPSGKVLAATSTDETVQLWDATDPAHPRPLGSPLSGHTSYINSIAFSRDGHTLATASSDGTVRMWDVSSPAHATALGHPLTGHTAQVRQVVFSPDGRTLATASEDKTVRLWDIGDRAHATALGQPLYGHTDLVSSVAFSPDGRTLAAGSSDDMVLVWNVTDPAHPAIEATVSTQSAVNAVAFSPDGRTLATADQDSTAFIWNLDITNAIQRICTTTRGVLTPREWQQYLSQLSYDPPC